MSSTDNATRLAELKASMDSGNPARARLTALFDPDSFVELDAFLQAEEGEAGVVAGYGLIEGGVAYAWSQDVTVSKGAVSAAHAGKIGKIYELAAKTGCPVVCVYDSHGAKLDEGGAMLAAYSKMLQSANSLSGVVPQISVVLGPCAGVSTMLAAGSDFVIMEKEAELFLTAPFIAKANGDSCEGAGSAANAAKAGVADLVCEGQEACLEAARKLLTMLPQNNLAAAPLFDYTDPAGGFDPAGCPKLIVKGIADADSVLELAPEFGKGVYTFLGTMAGAAVGFLATSRENPLDGDACEKAARFVKLCDAYSIPLVTLLGSKGFVLNSDVSVVRAAARMASAYAEATTAKVSVVTGTAFGPAYVAMGSKNGNADVTLAWPQAQISALAPETAVEFLWTERFKGTENAEATRKALVEEYIATEASPIEAAKQGYIEAVITPEETRKSVINMLDMLAGKRESKLPKKHATI